MAVPDTARLAHRIVRETARLKSHLPELDPRSASVRRTMRT